MKKFIALIAVATIGLANGSMYAQEGNAEHGADSKEQKETKQAQTKAKEKSADEIAYEAAVAALNAREFVLEADQVMFRSGRTEFVNTNTNFVLVNQKRGTVQVAFNTTYAGPNGIGGVTVDGTNSDIDIKTDKKGNVNCQFNIQGIGISAQVFINLTNGGNDATVTISPNFNSNTLTLRGNLIPLGQSNIFKGRSW